MWFLDKKGRFQSVSLGSIRQNEVCDFSLSNGRLYVFLHDRIVRYVVRKTDSGYDVGRGKTIATMTIKMAQPMTMWSIWWTKTTSCMLFVWQQSD